MNDKTTLFTRTNLGKGVAALFILLLTGALIESLFSGRAEFDFELTAEDFAGIFSQLAVTALIVERFVEIFASVVRQPGRVDLENDLDAAKGDAKQEVQKLLDQYKSKTGIFTLTISFIVGLIIAAVGVRLLAQMFDINELPRLQSLCFGAVDIVITAGVIAGGSKGVNALTSSVGAVFDAMKYQSRANEKKAKKDIKGDGG
jgi:phosphotransferase system  glucose/maltose/N-acetylglucosamine-specific IIC component